MAVKRGTTNADILNGTTLADQLFGLAGIDRLFGFAGNDLLDGGIGADSMTGGNGNDTYVVDNAGDRVIEGSNGGTDTVRSSVSITLSANIENLTLTGNALNGLGNGLDNVLTGSAARNVLRGLDGNDVLSGGAGTDDLFGGNGHDTLIPGAGFALRDVVDGGAGWDTVDYRDAAGGVNVDLSSGGIAGHASLDVITNVESVVGSRFADTLTPSNRSFEPGLHSVAFGGGGNDRITASSAAFDRIRGDDGFDVLQGNLGSTEDYWLQYNRGMDIVVAYRYGGVDDHVLISKTEFGLSTTANSFILGSEFLSANFNGGQPSFTASQRLIFEETSRILWADKDGAGTAFEPVPIAYFTPTLAASPSATDVFVI
ncbi:MAG: calcium-binding protein [Hyphomicrobium sp.]|nr:calcium-binding protein [Hyphomicrobium sp.]